MHCQRCRVSRKKNNKQSELKAKQADTINTPAAQLAPKDMPPPADLSRTDQIQNYAIGINILISLAAIIVAIVSAVYSYRSAVASEVSAVVAKETNERAAGRVPARVVVVDALPNEETIPEGMRKKVDDADYWTASVDNSESLLRLDPRIVLRNVGDEPVDKIFVRTLHESTWMKNKAGLPELPPSTMVEQEHVDSFELQPKLEKGGVVTIRVAKGILHQMLESQIGKHQEQERFGVFRCIVSAKTVGSTSPDPLVDYIVIRFRILWVPKNFPQKDCREILQNLKPRVDTYRPDNR